MRVHRLTSPVVLLLATAIGRTGAADSTVVFNEIMYNPLSPADSEWIELHNQMQVDMDISGWSLADGVSFIFPEGTIVAGGGYIVVAAFPDAVAAGNAPVLGPWDGALDNGGEQLTLVNNSGREMDSVRFDDRDHWPVGPDGSGVSLAKAEADAASAEPVNWTSSAEVGGTPGASNFGEEGDSSAGPAGLVAYWSFDEPEGTVVRDTVGENTGTIGDAVARVEGLAGSGALRFDNTGESFVDTGNGGLSDAFSATGGIAIEALIAPEWSGEAGEQDHIFRKQDGTRRLVLGFQHDGIGSNRDVPIDPAEQPVLSFGLNVSGRYTELDMPLDGQDGRPTLAGLKDGASHHVVATYDSATGVKALYIDGALAFSASLEAEGSISSGGVATAFIGNMAGLRHPFTGIIDEVAFWNRALEAVEIATHFENVRAGRSYFEAAPTGDGPAEGALRLLFTEMFVADDTASWVEITNVDGRPVRLGGAVIVNARGAGLEFTFPGEALAPGGRRAVDAAELGFDLLAEDKLFLYAAGRERVLDAVRLTEGNRGRPLDPRSPTGYGRWLVPSGPTRGEANRFALDERVVVNEIMYHAAPRLPRPPVIDTTRVVRLEGRWRFESSGTDLGASWREPDFDDAGWAVDQALFFNDDSNLPAAKNTPLPLGPTTYYFRTEFDFDGDPEATRLSLVHVVDDGAVFYLNGQEILRYGLPDGTVDHFTLADRRVGTARERAADVPDGALVRGRNVLAVELHQARVDDTDVAFGAALEAATEVEPPVEFAESPEAWLELYNRGDTAVDLTGWTLSDGARFAFEDGTVIGPGEYLVVAESAELLRQRYPDVPIVGDLEGRLGNHSDRLLLLDAAGNPADEVLYFDRGQWPRAADGFGSSLELRDPRADNSSGPAWAASREDLRSEWRTYAYRGPAQQVVAPSQWNELVLGLFQPGDVLIDDVSVIEDPEGLKRELIQNGDFQAGEQHWRFLGTHENSEVIDDPDDPGNRVLRVVSTGGTEHMHNHVETTYDRGARITNGRVYEISFRARWLSGSRQLNTRLYFSRLARTTVLASPELNGTPGRKNSVYESNIGPTFVDLGHDPVFPDAGEPVTVSVRAQDPDGVRAATVWWSADGGAWQNAAMTPGDDGLYQGIIPSQTDGVVQFYVEAEDELGLTAVFPPAGRDSGALFAVRDDAASRKMKNIRAIMTPAVSRKLLEVTNLMSNATVPATVVYDEHSVFYDCGVRLRGSQRGRPDASRTGYHLTFPPEKPFRGVHRTVALDRSGGWSSFVPFGSQDEILAKHVASHAGGIPNMYDDIVHMIVPQRSHHGATLLLGARFGDLFLDTQYENGSEGTVYTYELIYSPSTTRGGPEGLKLPNPDNVIGTDHRDLGEDKEDYRWLYLIENNTMRDDYSSLMRWTRAMGMSGAALDEATQETMDVDQFMRAFALYGLTGIGDTYMSGNFHNNQYYVRPGDNKVMVFPWDMDFTFVNAASSPLWGPHNLRKVIEIPRNTRSFYRHVREIIETTYNEEYMEYWVRHYGALDGVDYGRILGYIRQRGQFALNQIPRSQPLAVTTNDGEDFTVDAPQVELTGRAPIEIASLLVAELERQPEIVWDTVTRWRTVVPLSPGGNTLTFVGIGAGGEVLGSDGITITSALDEPAFIRGDATLDGRINVADAIAILLHLFSNQPVRCEDAADVNNDATVRLDDVTALVAYLFTSGEPPAAPFPEAGVDPEGDDGLGCGAGL